MKKLTVTAIILLTVLITKAQDSLKIPLKDCKIYYEQIVDVPNMTKDQLFKNAKMWYVESFKYSKSVIQNENLSDGNITGKGNTQFTCGKSFTPTAEAAYFTIAIDIKDNKYRVRIYDIVGDPTNWQDTYDYVFVKNKTFMRSMQLRYLTQFDI
jgi:hypothetical protein